MLDAAIFHSIMQLHCCAGIAQLVEHNLAKVGVASSSLVSRSRFLLRTSTRSGSFRFSGRRREPCWS